MFQIPCRLRNAWHVQTAACFSIRDYRARDRAAGDNEPSRNAGRMVSWKMKPIVFAREYLVVDKNVRYRNKDHDGCEHDQWQQRIAGST